METRVDEIAEGIFRLSTYLADVAAPAGLTVNQFVVVGDETLLFHCGMRAMFPSVAAAFDRIRPIERLRWIAVGHVEADECGAMNRWLAAAPDAQVVHGELGCVLSLNDLADRAPVPLRHGDAVDIGGRRLRQLETPHVPHNWESGLLYEEATATLLCGDLFTQLGDAPALTDGDVVDAALSAEAALGATALGAALPSTLRTLADLDPHTLAAMHGSSYVGDGRAALMALADQYERLTETAPQRGGAS